MPFLTGLPHQRECRAPVPAVSPPFFPLSSPKSSQPAEYEARQSTTVQRHSMRETLQFLGQCAAHIRTTGAVMPSGPHLSRKMVAAMGTVQPGQVVVELGPGTGVFTREIRRQYPHHKVVAVEFNEQFAQRLRERMNDVHVVTGCASQLREHLQHLNIDPKQVGAVISGLPLLSLPKELSHKIFASIADILEPGHRYVQFTYSKRMWKKFHPPGFRIDPTRFVLFNFPPAVVMPFTRIATSDAMVTANVG
jgi:phosphatidylethanolamine/phosphatidyl-N-methylethanolamine N-methyltransferase